MHTCFRYDKERQQFAVEIETVTTMLEAANKGKVGIHTLLLMLMWCLRPWATPAGWQGAAAILCPMPRLPLQSS